MSEPFPHYLNIAAKLKAYGVADPADPMTFVLGANLVTAEIHAERALTRLRSQLTTLDTGPDGIDAIDTADLSDAAEAVAAYHRARRHLLSAVERQTSAR